MDIRTATEQPKATYLKDYRPPSHRVGPVSLLFQLADGQSEVVSEVRYEAVDPETDVLVLDGDAHMALVSVAVDGVTVPADRMHLSDSKLTLFDLPSAFTLSIRTRLEPEKNTRLEGLYRSSGTFCTQCEAEGFRCITYFLDRPDVMATYQVRIEADKASCPVLLSNGNRIDAGDLEGARHFAVWEDPFPKPSYLFALVAGDLGVLSDEFTTRSGRQVALNIFAAERDLPRCHHAMESLKRSMRWDEEVFGLEYDLDIYNIVAVADFNMGAMENKSLNLFNTKYVLADPDLATDADFDHVEGVIAHEYFHNWTGNRVTCRDWFQLSLKEGLTVFRDQEFSADMGSRAVKRIDDVRGLRQVQFPEDAGPMAHPVRPESYIEINNFYTATIYNKGAEVIRMIHALLGPDGFRKGMDLYFERHDGQAVTCEDFVKAMEDASGADLGQFRLWYSQAGTPQVRTTGTYDKDTGTYTLAVEQSVPKAAGQKNPQAMHIPIRVALIGPNGQPLSVDLDGDGRSTADGTEWLLNLREQSQSFRFTGVASQPVPSLLRGFSAPVRLRSDHSRSDRLFLLAHDNDPFARWEVGQNLASDLILDLVDRHGAGHDLVLDDGFVAALSRALDDETADPALLAEAVGLPDESILGQGMAVVDVDAIHAARQFVRRELGDQLYDRWQTLYEAHKCGPYAWTVADKAHRRLRNVALGYLVASGRAEAIDLAEAHYTSADNMTDRAAALLSLTHLDHPARTRCFADFHARYSGEALAIDRWFALQAVSFRPDTVDQVRKLLDHPDFSLTNPNRLRSLIASFAMGNQVRFHGVDGRGYDLLAEVLATLDRINPQTTARMVSPLARWRQFDKDRQDKMKAALRKLRDQSGLSPDVYEIVTKSLGD